MAGRTGQARRAGAAGRPYLEKTGGLPLPELNFIRPCPARAAAADPGAGWARGQEVTAVLAASARPVRRRRARRSLARPHRCWVAAAGRGGGGQGDAPRGAVAAHGRSPGRAEARRLLQDRPAGREPAPSLSRRGERPALTAAHARDAQRCPEGTGARTQVGAASIPGAGNSARFQPGLCHCSVKKYEPNHQLF